MIHPSSAPVIPTLGHESVPRLPLTHLPLVPSSQGYCRRCRARQSDVFRTLPQVYDGLSVLRCALDGSESLLVVGLYKMAHTPKAYTRTNTLQYPTSYSHGVLATSSNVVLTMYSTTATRTLTYSSPRPFNVTNYVTTG